MFCCKRQDDRENRENRDDMKACCEALPYNDGWLIASQLLAIVATFFSWVWWPNFVISLIGLVIFQIPWCCRQMWITLYFSALVAGICSMYSLAIGIYCYDGWREMVDCDPVSLHGYNYDPTTQKNVPWDPSDDCSEVIWAIIAFVCAFLWAIAAACMFHFVHSGRHAECEECHNNPNQKDHTSSSDEEDSTEELGTGLEDSAEDRDGELGMSDLESESDHTSSIDEKESTLELHTADDEESGVSLEDLVENRDAEPPVDTSALEPEPNTKADEDSTN